MTQFPNFGQVPNGSGATVRAGFNSSDVAAATDHSGPTAPVVTHGGMRWNDTTNSILKRRDYGNSMWEIVENYGATAAPGADDDVLDGYVLGSRWLDATNNKVYFCLLAAAGVAVWQDISSGGGGTPVITATPAIAATLGAGTREANLNVPGVALGDMVQGVLPPAAYVGTIKVRGWDIIAADTLEITTFVEGVTDLSGLSGNWSVRVWDLT